MNHAPFTLQASYGISENRKDKTVCMTVGNFSIEKNKYFFTLWLVA